MFCPACPNNSTCNSTSFVCQTGFIKRESSCTVCPEGTFKDTDGTCSYCPSNSLCENDMFYCNAGYTPFRKECIPCASGKYKGSIGNDACLDCPVGAICNGTHFSCAPGNHLFLSSCTICPWNTFKRSIGNSSCLACPVGAICSATAITGCPSGYQPGDSECQPVSNDNNGAVVSTFGSISFAIIGGVGGLLGIAGFTMAIVIARSRAHMKSALEAKQRAERAETALTQMSVNQMATGSTNIPPRGTIFHGLTQTGTFNGFNWGQAATATTGTNGVPNPTFFDQFGKTYVSQTPGIF